MNTEKVISGSIMVFNTVYSISTIENIFSIALLVFQFIYLSVLIGLKIYRALKDKKITKEEFDDIKDSMDDLKDTIDKGGMNNDKRKE